MNDPPKPGDIAPTGAVAVPAGKLIPDNKGGWLIVPTDGVLWFGMSSKGLVTSSDWTSLKSPRSTTSKNHGAHMQLRKAIRDPHNGESIDRWLHNLAIPSSPETSRSKTEMIAHGWHLVVLMGQRGFGPPTVQGSPADADAIIGELEDLGLVRRCKRELGYAPEIMAFGVGGMTGDQLKKAEYPCLFGWTATPLLHCFAGWRRLQGVGPTFLESLAAWPGVHRSKLHLLGIEADPDNK